MSKVYTSIDQLIGHTPLLELTHFEADEDLKARVLVKLEYFNPAGSVKDRVAKNMIDEAEKAGKLVRGGDYTIIEPTSGNTGVGIASVAAARGYKVIITMPETMSVERRKLMQAYGAQLVLTDGSKGMKGAIAKAEELQKETPNSIIAGQFVNPANPAIHKRVAAALGVPADKDAVDDALGVDFKELMPRYTGRPLFSPREGRRVHPLTGAVQRWVPNQDGGYWDHCDFPLAEADDETIANWPVPDPDDFDYDELLDRCKLYRHKAVHFGHPGVSDVMNNTGMIRGMENIYMDLALETESVMTLLDRRMKAELAMFERALDKCRDYVDFIWTGEDLGTQRAPLISLDMFRAQIRPRHQPLVDLASSYGKPVMIHCCGSSSWAFEDFIEMGIRAVDTLQPEAADMDPACLARKYGGRLAFHGCISTAKLAVMTPEAVAQNVAETLETMMPHHGYCLAPTHYLQDNTPVENVIAMYRTAHRLGRY